MTAISLGRHRPRRPAVGPNGEMTVVQHLSELRRRLFVSLLAVLVGAVIAYVFSKEIISFLVTFYRDATGGKRHALIFTGPLDGFLTRLKIATYGGIVLALPVWLYQLWRFVTPALDRREKRYAVPFVLSSLALFALGAAVAFLTLTEALSFLFGVGGAELQPLLTADKYLSLVSLMVIAFGLSFEFPVLIMFLLLARVISTKQLRRWRRIAIVVIVAFAALITPSADPYSLFAMAIPMYVFYEACIGLGRVLKR
jgi:sec-independent protein translocase protein TatC